MPEADQTLSAEEEALLHREVMFQAWTAELAWNNLLAALRPPQILQEAHRARTGTATREPMTSPVIQAFLQWQVQIWSLTRLMLAGAATVSRILWPLTRREPRDARERAQVGRAAELRRRWGLDADSYLADRDARDVFEHVDEKLLEWLDEHRGQPVQGLAMAEVAASPELRTECFRLIDPVTKIVYAGTKECNLVKVFDALRVVSDHLPPMVHRIDFNLPSVLD